MEGYLYKQSLHLKQLRKRWVILNEKDKHLYCYKNGLYKELTEKINLSTFHNVNGKFGQFQLISAEQKRIFVAESVEDMNNWMLCIKNVINTNIIIDNHTKENECKLTTKNTLSISNAININNSACFETACNGDALNISNCISISRVSAILKKHTKHNENQSFPIHLINDYHHILQYHLNENNMCLTQSNKQFELIYQQIIENDSTCDISRCAIYSRNNRQREHDSPNQNVSLCDNLLDSIHCFFMHSIDTDHMIHHKLNDNSEMPKLKLYLKNKRKNIQHIRGMARFSKNKFITNIDAPYVTDVPNKKDTSIVESKYNEQDDRKNNKDDYYSFGQHRSYWEYYSPKYASLKAELLNNKIFSIGNNIFSNAFEKAEHLINNSDEIKQITSSAEERYKIQSGVPLNVSNVVSIVLYTDYDTLSYHFSQTFRAIKKRESAQKIRKRNNEYFNWSKILCETVNCYGTMMKESNVKIFYHGVSYLYFSKFVAEFKSPTSTTTKLQIATIFANNDGIILELQQAKYGWDLKHFNCSFISCFGNEDERLFINPPRYQRLQIVSIRNMSTDENYKEFIKAFNVFNSMVELGLWMPGVSPTTDIINNLISYAITRNKHNYPNYILKCFNNWCNTKTYIEIDFDTITNLGINLLVCDDQVKNLVNFNHINIIFPNMNEIKCENVSNVDSSFLQLLLANIQQIKKSKLTRIELYKVEECYSNKDFAKCQSLFMKTRWSLIKRENQHKEWLDYPGLVIFRH
eukprot:333236_1